MSMGIFAIVFYIFVLKMKKKGQNRAFYVRFGARVVLQSKMEFFIIRVTNKFKEEAL